MTVDIIDTAVGRAIARRLRTTLPGAGRIGMNGDGFVEVSEDRLAERVARLGKAISVDYADRDRVLVGVLRAR